MKAWGAGLSRERGSEGGVRWGGDEVRVESGREGHVRCGGDEIRGESGSEDGVRHSW